ncbi:MAG TPA: hypothetical protein VFI33_08375 [Puia sp.]|nr:hypothetical protein [Puia sp.]
MDQENILDEEVLELNGKKRPTAITVLCIIEFISAAAGLVLIFTGYASKIARWYPPFLALATINQIICTIGFWKMKKWALYLYFSFVVLMNMIMVSMGVWYATSLIMPIIVISILLNFISKMS